METIEDFSALVDRVATLNSLDKDLAAELVAEVGDTPMVENGLVVVTDSTGKQHRLQWPWEGE